MWVVTALPLGNADFRSAQSTALNQSRLEVLRKRDENLQNLFEEANKQVTALADGKEYPQAMELLILEVRMRLRERLRVSDFAGDL